MSECARSGKWFRGCNFEARYDEKLQRRQLGMASDFFWENITLPPGKTAKPEQLIPTDTVTYVRDVCTRCGRTIERSSHDT